MNYTKKKIIERNQATNLDNLIELDKENREFIQKKEKLEQEKKIISKSKDPENFKKSKKLTDQIKVLDQSQKKLSSEINKILFSIPNIALEDVPVGQDEKTNKILKKFGEIKEFNFKVKSHSDLGGKLMDFDTAAK